MLYIFKNFTLYLLKTNMLNSFIICFQNSICTNLPDIELDSHYIFVNMEFIHE